MAEAAGVVDTGRGEADRAVLKPLFEKLKPGPGLSREEVLADQRQRLRSAVISLVASQGWKGVKVRSLARAAGVSSASFYRSFSNTDECLATALEANMTEVIGSAASVQHRGEDWRVSLRAAVEAFMQQLATHPQASRVALLDVFSAGPTARRRIPRAFAEIEGVLARSFQTDPDSPPVPRHLIAGMAAGMLRVARKTSLVDRVDELPGLADALTEWMVSLPRSEVTSLLAPQRKNPRREPRPFPTETDPSYSGAAVGDRECLLRATVRLGTTDGYASLSPARIRAEAGVSRRRFEETFTGADDCFLESIAMVATEGASRAYAWSSESEDWRSRTCRLIVALSAQAARKRRLARLAFIDILGPGRAGLVRREELLSRAAAELRATVPADERPSEMFAEASVAAAWHIAQVDIASGRAKGLPAIAPLLSYVVLAPIVGAVGAAEAAREEAGWR